MKKISVPACVALLLLGFNALLFAQENIVSIPRLISYQGFITDASKNPVSGEHLITVKIYDSQTGGNTLHGENFIQPVDRGVFSVMLGSIAPLGSSLAFDKQYWVGISIDGGAELSPRTAFTSAPYAMRANEANALAPNAIGAVRTFNGKSGDLILKAGTGADIVADGNTITISTKPIINAQAQGNGNVTSITGTANQVLANGTSGVAQGGNVTLTTPQNIHAGASPTFAGMTLSGLGTGVVHSSAAGNLSSASIVDADISASAAIADSKLAIISTSGKVANSATTGSSSNSPSTLILRDGSGNFSAGEITASSVTISGKASSAATLSSDPSICLTTKGYVDNATSTSWSITGNTGLTSSNYLGTNDATDLSLRTGGIERMKLTSDGSLLLAGNSGAIPASGSGTRMMWVPSLGAFRAGKANTNEWNAGNIGAQSVAIGYGNLASGSQSVAMGFFSSAYGMGSTAIGSGAAAYADAATAFGAGSQAVGFNSVAMGDNSTAWSDDAVAIGSNTSATGFASTAFGYNTTTTANGAMATGKNLTVGLSSFGFNGSTGNSIVNVSGINNFAYFGDVDLAIGNDDNTARSLRFYGKNSSSTLSGAYYTSFKSGVQGSNISYTLPTAQGTANSLMINNGAGALSWASLSSLNILAGSALHYDNVNNRLGIGNSSPAEVLDVTGNANITGTVTAGNGITMTGGKAVLSYGTVSAGDAIAIPDNAIVKITDDGATAANNITMPTGTNGQIIYIYNNDADATTGDATIASGATGTFIYADGWHKTN